MSADDIVDLYERHAHAFDRDRGNSLQEKTWLDAFLRYVRHNGTILDIGCGTGRPIARYLLESGYHVVGIDSSPSMIALCRDRFPQAEWRVADMRTFAPSRRYDGILAWDSFFHLSMNDQRAMFPRFASCAADNAPLMFTSGPSEGIAMGSYEGDPLFHASLSRKEYTYLLEVNGFTIQAHKAEDPDCGGHEVWLATYGAAPL